MPPALSETFNLHLSAPLLRLETHSFSGKTTFTLFG